MKGTSARVDLAEARSARAAENAIGRFAAAVVLSDAVDPLVTELVRLRCARVHDCRLCGSLRQRKALQQGLTESMADKVDVYEHSDLPANAKAALRLCDAMILTPGRVPATLRSDLQAHFSPRQIAELMLDIVKWSQQKALVAVRTENPPWTAIHELDFDDNGDPLFCGDLEVSR